MFGDEKTSENLFQRWIWAAWAALVIALLLAIFFLTQILSQLGEATRQRDAIHHYTLWVATQLELNLRGMDAAIDIASDPVTGWFGYRQLRDDLRHMQSLIEGIDNDLKKSEAVVPVDRPKFIQEFIAAERSFIDTYTVILELPDSEVGDYLPAMRDDLRELDSIRMGMLRQPSLGSSELENDPRFTRPLEKIRSSGTLAVIVLAALLVLNIFLLLTLRNKDRAIALVMGNMTTIIDASRDAVFLADEDLKVVGLAPSTLKMFGATRDKVLSRRVFDFFANESSEIDQLVGMLKDLSDPQSELTSHRAELNGLRMDYSTFPVDVRFSAIRGQDGHLIYVISVADMSEQAERESVLMAARNEALQAERAKSRFLSSMSHEMRTPLNGVLASLDLMRETTKLSERQTELAAIIERCGDEALEQVENVLELTRLDTMAKTAINLAPFAPAAALREIVEANQEKARANNNAMRFETLVPDNQFVSGSAILFRQIMHNFISNAIKFTVNGDIKVTLSSREVPDSQDWEITAKVSDTGIGILEEDLERIFKNFETIRDSFSHFKSGSGLGLSIAKNSADLMGGRIEVNSEPGQGSSFALVVVCAPVKDGGDGLQTKTNLGQRTVEGQKQMEVLVVEDNEINRRMLVDMLHAKGHSVTEATDGLEGVSAGRDYQYDLILMDISMPKLDGVGATRMLRQFGKSRHSPIVAVTAHSQPEHMREFLEAGMDRVLTKPLRMATLDQLFKEMGHGGEKATGTNEDTGKEEEMIIEGLIEEDVFHGLIDMLGGDSVGGYVAQFETDVQDMLPRYNQAIKSADFATARAEAHRCAGGAAVIGADKVHGVLQEMTHAADAGDAAKCQSLAESLPKLTEHTMAAMRQAIG